MSLHSASLPRALVLVSCLVAGTLHARLDVEFLNTDGHVFTADERKTVETIAVEAEAAIRRLLPDLPPEMLLTVMADAVPETGATAMAFAPGYVRWVVDTKHPEGVCELARRQLRESLYHEFHHIVRGWVAYGGAPMETFMDAVIAEGLASVFERAAGGPVHPWAHYDETTAAWVDELLPLPPDAPYAQWMFKHPDGRRWIGYRAGTYLVDKAVAASGKSAGDLVRAPTAEILALVGVALPPQPALKRP